MIKEERAVGAETLSADAYWQALEVKLPGARPALEKLIAAAEPLGVYPEFLKSLNFKWPRPDEKPINLGYVFKHASLWTDAASWTAPRDLAYAYVEDLAATFGCDAHTLPTSGKWTLYKDSKPLRLGQVMDRLDAWPPVVQRFIAAVQRHDAMAM